MGMHAQMRSGEVEADVIFKILSVSCMLIVIYP